MLPPSGYASWTTLKIQVGSCSKIVFSKYEYEPTRLLATLYLNLQGVSYAILLGSEMEGLYFEIRAAFVLFRLYVRSFIQTQTY
jgi:hypothetical protein